MPKPAYPAVLTRAKWEKEKGVIAKIFKKETGLGPKLAELEEKFSAIQFDPLEKTDYSAAPGVGECNLILKARQDKVSKTVEAFVPLPKGVSDLATKTATELKKNPLVPKSTLEYLKGIPAACTQLSESIASYVQELSRNQDTAIKARLKAIDQEAAAGQNEARKYEAQIKKIGDDYVKNRKLALTQMQDLKKLALDSQKKVDTFAAAIDKAAKSPLGSPDAAKKVFSGLQKQEADAKAVFNAFDNRWLNEGDVQKSQVQRDARGNINRIQGKPELDPFIQAYQKKSDNIFNEIMANVAEIIAVKHAMENAFSAMSTNINIVGDIVLGSSKTLADHQKTAKEIALEARKALETAAGLHEKMETQQKSVNALVANAKADPTKVESSHNYIITTIGELERRVIEFTGAATRIQGSARRITVLAPVIQNDASVKASMNEVTTAQQKITGFVDSLRKMVANSKTVQSQLPKPR